MNSQHYLQKAKKSARNQFILTVFCVELLFILVAILWSLATGSLFVSIVTAFFCLIVPIAAFIEWNKEIDKSKITRTSELLSLRINLSLCQKEDWASIVEAIVSHSPNVTLNDLASEIKRGQIPYF